MTLVLTEWISLTMDLAPPTIPPPRDRAKSMGYLNIPTSLLCRNSASRQSVGEIEPPFPPMSVLRNLRRASEIPHIHINPAEGSDVDDFRDGFSPERQGRKLSLKEVLVPMIPQIMQSNENIHESLERDRIADRKLIVIPEHKFGEIKKSVTLSQNYKPAMSLFKPGMQMQNNSQNLQVTVKPPAPVIPPVIEAKPLQQKKSKVNKRDLNSFAPISM